MSVKGVNFAIKGTNQAGPAMRQFQGQMSDVQRSMRAIVPATASWSKGLSDNRRMIQQVGFQMTDFGVQIAGGQSAMLAFVQQGGQMLQFFGPFGAIAAAMVTIFGTMAIMITKSGMALNSIMPIFGVFQSELSVLIDVISWVFQRFIDVINLVLNNLDVLATAGVFYLGRLAMAAFLASNTFRAMALSVLLLGPAQAAAMIASMSLTAALVALRGVLLTILPTAVLIAISWLVVKLFELRAATGSWAEVLGLLGDVAKGVWRGIWESAKAIPPALASVWQSVTSDFYNMVSDMINAWAGMLGTMGRAVEGFMPDVAANFFDAASNAVTSSTEWAEDANEAASESAASWAKAGAIVTNAWAPAAAAVQKIKDILNKDDVDVRDWFGGGDKGKGGGDGGGGKDILTEVEKLAKETKKIFDDVAGSIYGSLMTGFKGVIKGTKSLKDAALDVLDSILDKTIELLMMPIFKGIAGSIAGSILKFTGLGVPEDMSFAGGGFTGRGSRSGGVDGKGGFRAILHPNETVIDHTMGQSVRGGSGGSGGAVGGTIHLYIHESEGFASTVDARAEGVAIKVSTEVVRQYDRKVLSSSVNRVSNDPTYKAR